MQVNSDRVNSTNHISCFYLCDCSSDSLSISRRLKIVQILASFAPIDRNEVDVLVVQEVITCCRHETFIVVLIRPTVRHHDDLLVRFEKPFVDRLPVDGALDAVFRVGDEHSSQNIVRRFWKSTRPVAVYRKRRIVGETADVVFENIN